MIAPTIIRLDINYDTPKDAGPAFEAHETRIFTDTPEGIAEAIRQAKTINDPQEGEAEPEAVANEVEISRCTLNGCGYVCSERIEIDQESIRCVPDDHPGMGLLLTVARILFHGGWNIRQFFSPKGCLETFTITNGEDELSITPEIFGAFIDSSRKDYAVISDKKGISGMEKIFSYRSAV